MKEIYRGFERLKKLKNFYKEKWKIKLINEGKIKILENYEFKDKEKLIKSMSEKKKIDLLVEFIYIYKRKDMEEKILEMVNFFEKIFRSDKNKEDNERIRKIKDLESED